MNFQGHNWNSVGLDEGHEMGINREVKGALNSFSPESMSRILYYLYYRGKLMGNLKELMGRSTSHKHMGSQTISTDTERNVQSLLMKMRLANVQPFAMNYYEVSVYLFHIFSGLQASKLQEEDMMSFRSMGEEALSDYIKCNVIQYKNQKGRKRIKLNTFGQKKLTTVQRRSQVQYEKRVSSTLRRMIGWSKLKGVVVEDIQQMISLPSVLCSSDGMPYSSQKCKTTSFFQKRYPECFIQGTLPPTLQPKCVVIDAMFMLFMCSFQIETTNVN